MMIMDRYNGVHPPLRKWFEAFQEKHPEAHISCGARGQVEQEMLFQKKATRAHFGQSSHNYGAALDLFEISAGSSDIYSKAWFEAILAPNLPDWIEWYGRPGASFYELPHIEVKQWKDLVAQGILKIVKGIAA
jgi:hypothetical protein